MTQRSWFWAGTTVGDAALPAPYGAPYSAAMFSEVLSMLLQRIPTLSGVIYTLHPDYSPNLEVLPSHNGKIWVYPGLGLVDGTLYANDTNVELDTHGVAGTYSVVLRKDSLTQTVRAVLRDVGITQVEGVTWEVELARVLDDGIGNLFFTDYRIFTTGIIANAKRQQAFGTTLSPEWGAASDTYNPVDWELINIDMQIGCALLVVDNLSDQGEVLITYPRPFFGKPLLYVTPVVWGTESVAGFNVCPTYGAEKVSVRVRLTLDVTAQHDVGVKLHWIGPRPDDRDLVNRI